MRREGPCLRPERWPHLKKKIRIAILGAGSILKAHAAGFRRAADRCAVVAVAREHASNTDEVRELFGNVPVDSDWRKTVARDDVDAVDILLPHDLHLAATVEAARAGKHVMVEKVMARNIDECDRMIKACQKAGVSLSVCHDRRYQPDWMALQQVVASGLLGRVHLWRLEHNQDVDLPAGSWIRSAERLGGGAVMSCLTHQIDGLRWYAGEVESVTCMTQVMPARMEGETIGVIAARMKSGALAQLSINWATRMGWGRPNDLWSEVNHVTGERGEAYYVCGKGTFLALRENPAAAAHLFEGKPPAAGRRRPLAGCRHTDPIQPQQARHKRDTSEVQNCPLMGTPRELSCRRTGSGESASK